MAQRWGTPAEHCGMSHDRLCVVSIFYYCMWLHRNIQITGEKGGQCTANGTSTLVTHQPYTEMDLNTCRPEQRSGLVAIYYSALCDVVPEQRQALLFWCATEENGIPGNS